jgi:hypothetical protein
MEFYLNEVNKLEFDSEPPYNKIHTKLNEALRRIGATQSVISGSDNFMIFSSNKVSGSKTQLKVFGFSILLIGFY